MNKKKCIMVGFDFIGANYPSALYTLQQWSRYFQESKDFEIVFGVTTSCDFNQGLIGASKTLTQDALRSMSQYCQTFVYWEQGGINRANHVIKETLGSDCFPFYEGFSYGALINKLLLLAHVNHCDYLVRIDPGTCPPTIAIFDEIMHEHIDIIGDSKKVVSRGYEGRLAIRDIFIRDKRKKDHVSLIQKATAIDPNSQITGGAMFTSSLPGIPAMPFERYGLENSPTLIWGSDDAVYRIFLETEGSRKLTHISIPRFDKEGKRKTTIEYYRGVMGMVYLSTFLRTGEKTRAEGALGVFFKTMKGEYIDPDKYRPDKEGGTLEKEFILKDITPELFLERICQGCENHKRLVSSGTWEKIADTLRSSFGK